MDAPKESVVYYALIAYQAPIVANFKPLRNKPPLCGLRVTPCGCRVVTFAANTTLSNDFPAKRAPSNLTAARRALGLRIQERFSFN